jgi:hypothetical protein
MRNDPILTSSIKQRIVDIERRLTALAQPHDLASEVDLGQCDISILGSDPLNTWVALSNGFLTVVRGTHLYARYTQNFTTKASQDIEFRYYQEDPVPATSELVLLTSTIPLASASSTFIYDIDLTSFSPLIVGTRGRIQLFTRRNAAFSGGDSVLAYGRLSMGG